MNVQSGEFDAARQRRWGPRCSRLPTGTEGLQPARGQGVSAAMRDGLYDPLLAEREGRRTARCDPRAGDPFSKPTFSLKVIGVGSTRSPPGLRTTAPRIDGTRARFPRFAPLRPVGRVGSRTRPIALGARAGALSTLPTNSCRTPAHVAQRPPAAGRRRRKPKPAANPPGLRHRRITDVPCLTPLHSHGESTGRTSPSARSDLARNVLERDRSFGRSRKHGQRLRRPQLHISRRSSPPPGNGTRHHAC